MILSLSKEGKFLIWCKGLSKNEENLFL